MDAKEIKVLIVEPGKHPKVTTIMDDLDSLQKAVSIGADYQGLIEIIGIGKTVKNLGEPGNFLIDSPSCPIEPGLHRCKNTP